MGNDDKFLAEIEVLDDENGENRARITISRPVWAVFLEAGEMRKKKAAGILDDFMSDVFDAANTGRLTVRIPPVLVQAIQSLKVRLTSEALEKIDISVLARNNRVRGTGFDGVYNHRGAFVVDARDPATLRMRRMPGRYPEPELAAWARYQHYRKYKIPYGRLEDEIEKQRNSLVAREEKWSEAYIRAYSIWSLSVDGTPPDRAFLESSELRWLTENPLLKMQQERGEDELDPLNLPPMEPQPVLVKLERAALPAAPKQTIEAARSEAEMKLKEALELSRAARAVRMAAKHAPALDDEDGDD